MSADLGGSVAAEAVAAEARTVPDVVSGSVAAEARPGPDVVGGSVAAEAVAAEAQDWLGLVADELGIELGISGQQDAVPPDRDPAELAVVAAPPDRDPAELAVVAVPDRAELAVVPAVKPPKPRLPAPQKRSLEQHQLASANMHLAKLRKKVHRIESQSQGINTDYKVDIQTLILKRVSYYKRRVEHITDVISKKARQQSTPFREKNESNTKGAAAVAEEDERLGAELVAAYPEKIMSISNRAEKCGLNRWQTREKVCKVAHVKLAQQMAALLRVLERVMSGEWTIRLFWERYKWDETLQKICLGQQGLGELSDEGLLPEHGKSTWNVLVQRRWVGFTLSTGEVIEIPLVMPPTILAGSITAGYVHSFLFVVIRFLCLVIRCCRCVVLSFEDAFGRRCSVLVSTRRRCVSFATR